MHAPPEAAVRARDDALPPHQFREALDAVGHQLGVLDHVGGMADHARDEKLALRQLHVLPHSPFVLVADIAGLERIGLTVDGQHHLDDVPHGNIRDVRTMPAAPAQVETDPVPRQSPQRVIERLHADHRELPVRARRGRRVDHVPVLGDGGIVELEDESRVDDGLVLLPHGVGAGVDELLLGLVVLVADPGGAARRDGGHEALLDPGRRQRALEALDVRLDRRVARIRERARAHGDAHAAPAPRRGGDTRMGIGVGGGEELAVAPVREAREPDLTGL